MGLTLECARCHDHKYDPTKTKEYYQLSSFFANIDERGLISYFTDAVPTPAAPWPSTEQQEVLHLLGMDHERLTFKYQGRHFRFTDVHGNVVRDVLA